MSVVDPTRPPIQTPRAASESDPADRPRYLVRRLADAPVVDCHCGPSARLLTRPEADRINFHVTTIFNAIEHYHKITTEYYYILEGTGTLHLDNEPIEVEPGTLVVIEPGVRHRLVSVSGVKTLVMGTPALDPSDEYFDADPLRT